jgi:preprotein translocase subunit YajC
MKVWDSIKGKVDKKAAGLTIGLLLMSWLAFPIIYYMIVRSKKEVKKDENMG